MDYRSYRVSRASKKPLHDWILASLKRSGCKILGSSGYSSAPFRITFEDSNGLKNGIIVYAFLANSKTTKNRPEDEHRFQIKYGSKDGMLHQIWQDPFQLYTTLVVGIDPIRDVFVGIDPILHGLTKFFISIEFKKKEVEEILEKGWHYWERDRRSSDDFPIETMVGGTIEAFYNYALFETAAKGLDQGHRSLLAENFQDYLKQQPSSVTKHRKLISDNAKNETEDYFGLSVNELLEIIHGTPRLLMPVRGWVAERHLKTLLENTEGIDSCTQLEQDGRPDFEIVYKGGKPMLIECKNVLRKTLADGTIRLDFQKTRASKGDPCSRFYKPSDFEILAACLHPCTEKWQFKFHLTSNLALRKDSCTSHFNSNVRITEDWTEDIHSIMASV